MLQKSVSIAIVGSLVLTGCATTSQNPDTVRANQQKYEQATYRIVHQDKVGGADLILRELTNKPEDHLTIVTRGKTAAASSLMLVGIVATKGMYTGGSFTKDQLKGKILEPKLKSTVLDQAKPAFANWLATNHDSITPKDKPITKMTVTAGRFSLIYGKLVGAEAYELNTDLGINIQTNWNNDTAYKYLCDIRSNAKTLDEWKKDNYRAVESAIASNIQSCLNELNGKKGEILRHLSK